jgi:hypothetical protein
MRRLPHLAHLTAYDAGPIDGLPVWRVTSPGGRLASTEKGKAEMVIPGAYFRDETAWRGRMLSVVLELRRAIFELGFWISGMYLSLAVSKWWADAPIVFGTVACVRFAASYYDQLRGEKKIDSDIEQYFSERHPADRP